MFDPTFGILRKSRDKTDSPAVSIEAMNWALGQQAGSSSAKMVLLILANRANQDGICWPGFAGIAEQTELSRRSVINNVQKLIDRGLVVVQRRPQPKTNIYKLNLRNGERDSPSDEPVDSETDALVKSLHSERDSPNGEGGAPEMVKEVHLDSEGGAPEPKETQTKPTKNPKGRSRLRATRLPKDCQLTPEWEKIARAEGVDPKRTFTKFKNFWLAKSGANATKLDWKRTWQNWCMSDAEKTGCIAPQVGRKLTRYEQLFGTPDE